MELAGGSWLLKQIYNGFQVSLLLISQDFTAVKRWLPVPYLTFLNILELRGNALNTKLITLTE